MDYEDWQKLTMRAPEQCKLAKQKVDGQKSDWQFCRANCLTSFTALLATAQTTYYPLSFMTRAVTTNTLCFLNMLACLTRIRLTTDIVLMVGIGWVSV